MSEHLRESVSALMDGEADELELRRLLAAENADTVNRSWSNYHLVRDSLHSTEQSSEFRHLDISQQVSMAIAEESAAAGAATDTVEKPARWWQPAAGFAVAASVAVVVVFGVQTVDQSSQGLNSSPAVATTVSSSQAAVASRVYPVQAASMQASSTGTVSLSSGELPGDNAATKAAADIEAQKRLEKYILRHTERAALNNGQGVISFARVPSFEEQ
ncbi:sigma-E factor negative regulatory protein [Oceanicoccus sagamiensis]|uniref:Anti sigma-E protein RseA N-terminal domain-containing protein n=1 Tax=Oceanicoccus sagamiensis TaxID=716816 RepID=A0A1X9NG23_9GAMM|nr:sigma-E factor negative regulatory protein [Oceanicoccus sagamiensis]ARN75352.1 hypothetical protein BST96_15265 [Oceanicoccus sagamiensis]